MDHLKLAVSLLSRPSFEVVALPDATGGDGIRADSDEAMFMLCPVLGPSATMILHRLSRYASVGPTVWEPEPFAATFGLSSSTLAPKALSRLSRFGCARLGAERLAVRTTVPHMPPHWLAQLPDYLRDNVPLAA